MICQKFFMIKIFQVKQIKFYFQIQKCEKNIINIDNWFKIDEKVNGNWSKTHLLGCLYSFEQKRYLDLNLVHNSINSKVFNLKFKKKQKFDFENLPFWGNY